MHSNPVQTGFWHIQSDTIANGFNFARKRQAAQRAWLTNDVPLQWQEAINNEIVDNKAVHFSLAGGNCGTKAASIRKLSDVWIILDNIETSLRGK